MALVLARRSRESVLIHMPDGQFVAVTVLEINGSQVKLAFDAPRSVTIHRAEVQQRIDSGEPQR